MLTAPFRNILTYLLTYSGSLIGSLYVDVFILVFLFICSFNDVVFNSVLFSYAVVYFNMGFVK